jgi:dimeric dUTPase (all-alpha-NTP-PPase superfamily)
VLRKPRLLHDPLILATLFIMLLSIAYIVYSFWPQAAKSQNVNILEDYVKAVQYLNKSSTALEKRLAGSKLVAMDFSLDNAFDVRSRIQWYLLNISLAYGSEDTFFVGVAKNYLNIAEAATNSTVAYYTINGSIDTLREALQLLALCRVDEALEKFSGIVSNVSRALPHIAKAVSILRKIDENLVAENHVPIINSSLKRLEKVFDSIYNTYKLMEIAKEYRDYIEALCSKKPVNNTAALGNLLNNVDAVKASGPLSPDIANAKNSLKSLIHTYLGNQQGMLQKDKVGGGAGYAPPESDD